MRRAGTGQAAHRFQEGKGKAMRMWIHGRMNVTRLDARMRSELDRIHELELLRHELMKKSDRLVAALRRVPRIGDDDLIHVPGGLAQPRDLKMAERSALVSGSAGLGSGGALDQRLAQMCLFRRILVEQASQTLHQQIEGLDSAIAAKTARLQDRLAQVQPDASVA